MAKVKIYTVDYCPYCKRALSLLKEIGSDFEDIDITDNEGEMRSQLMEQTGIRTVPQIFIDEKFIGGSDTLTQLHQSGELAQMLS